MMLAIIAIVSFMLLWHTIWMYRIRSRLPPGPAPWPVAGNLLEFWDKNKRKTVFDSLASKYGDVFTLWFGYKPVLFAATLDGYTALFKNNPHAFLLKERTIIGSILCGRHISISTSSYCPEYVAARKMVICLLRAATPSDHLERVVEEAISDVLSWNNLTSGGCMDVKFVANEIVTKILSQIACNHKTAPNEQLVAGVVESSKRYNIMANTFFILSLLPGAATIASYLSSLPEGSDVWSQILRERHEASKTGRSLGISDGSLLNMIVNVMIGIQPIAALLHWVIEQLALNQDDQQRCFLQIQATLNNNKPKLSDKHKLTYVDAFMMETLRLNPVIRIPQANMANEDVNIGSFKVRKGTVACPLIGHIQVDSKYWNDPQKFNARRFLDPDGNIVNQELLVSFGSGIRKCVGEQFVKRIIFLATTILIRDFEISCLAEEKYDFETVDGDFSAGTPANEPKVILTRRSMFC